MQNSLRNEKMEGLYLYCIRDKTEDPSSFHAGGIDGKGEVFTIIHNELEAIVSRVSLSEFTSDEIQKKAQDDLNWIKEKAVIHEDVIEEAMRGIDGLVSVIPMRFGIIFKDKAGLEETLDRDQTEMRALLNKIRGKQEWSVKIYLMDSKIFESMVKERNKEIKLKEKEIASMTEGMAFFMEEELKETVRDEVNKELDTMLDGLFEKLGEEAAESVKTKLLDKEMTGRTESMVLNAAFLIHADKVNSFTKTLDNMAGNLTAKGFRLEYGGPWPPFNFTNGREKA
jgi:hypothetical protein